MEDNPNGCADSLAVLAIVLILIAAILFAAAMGAGAGF